MCWPLLTFNPKPHQFRLGYETKLVRNLAIKLGVAGRVVFPASQTCRLARQPLIRNSKPAPGFIVN